MNDRMKRFFSRLFTWKKLAISGVGLAIVLAALGFVFYEITKTSVTIYAEDVEHEAVTHAGTVEEVLEEQGIEVGFHDHIEPSLDTLITDETDITIIRANQITMMIDGERTVVWTTATTVGELLREVDLDIGEHDFLSPSTETQITSETDIVYEPAFEVTVYIDGKEENIMTTSTTVADFLEQHEIMLNELDKIEPAVEERLNNETDLTVVRVEKVTDVVEEAVDFATVRKNDSSLDQGNEKVVNSGKDGRLKKHYEVIFEDGEEVSRELVKEEMVEESKDRIVAVGTKSPAPVTTTVSRGSSSNSSASSDSSSTSASAGGSSNNTSSDTSSNTSSSSSSSSGSSSATASNSSSSSSGSSSSSSSSSSGSWQTFEATAYTANCTGCSGITATGINLKDNPDARVIAVDPSVIPLGSRVEVKGYGTYLAGDTGGAIQGRKIDIFMPSGAGSFGRRSVEVRILD
ncbi:ubiquitin-like domain-containing protein [Alteribacter salitolerans]|uniref:ubiquitin-like domain-containing protein n=1 Tax=Alteribacter salitolerans TaxID=2912333 RepID=UPI001F1AC631|nr:G5 and 3D domain-containing protein [Alteribacter salitolerans]